MRSISITSGKGGVGKTNLAANLAIALAQFDRKVVLVDGDIGLANLDIVLDIHPLHRLQSVASGKVLLRDALVPGPCGIRFLGGGSGPECVLNLAGSEAESFLSQLSDLASETDDLIIDTGAGMNPNVMAFLEVSDTVLVVSTQDPSSMADAYAITKACCVSRRDADLRLVVNMADSEADANVVHRRFSSVAHQFLGRSIPYAGFVRSDSKAVACTRNRKPFLLGAPNTAASLDTINVARRLIGVSVDSRQGIVGRLRDLLSGEQRMAS